MRVSLTALIVAVCVIAPAHARDEGRYANMDPAIHDWFDQLASGKGKCCSFADGFSIQDVDWDTGALTAAIAFACTANGSMCRQKPW